MELKEHTLFLEICLSNARAVLIFGLTFTKRLTRNAIILQQLNPRSSQYYHRRDL